MASHTACSTGPSGGMQGPEKIAIIGMACRLPGGVDSPSSFWDMMVFKRSGHCDIPEDRWNAMPFYNPKSSHPGGIITTEGYFLQDDISSFDYPFFSMTEKEAIALDPQQRLAMETAYECLESGGITLEQISGTKTACYMGCFQRDWGEITIDKEPEMANAYSATGSSLTMISNRINHMWNLKGPSMTIDTACSSSLYALHMACLSLRAGDCDGALVGGVNLMLSLDVLISATKLGFLSPDGFSNSFDKKGDGYGRGEGASVIYVKRLSDALRDGDPIRAVISGSAVNANGKTRNIVHPNVEGHEACIRHAYKTAGLPFSETGYFEAHAAGTPVGDPYEVTAIGNVFADQTYTPENPLYIGSVKPNIGHTEANSGLAGLVKVVLALEKGMIPPMIGYETPHPALDLKNGALKIVTELIPWPQKTIKRASLNSSGFGGANAHFIIDSAESYVECRTPLHPQHTAAPPPPPPPHHVSGYEYALSETSSESWEHLQVPAPDESPTPTRAASSIADSDTQVTKLLLPRSSFLFPFSAKSEYSLKHQTLVVCGEFHHPSDADVAHTLSGHRTRHSRRSYVVRNDKGRASLDVKYGKKKDSPATAFVFTGQGAAWPCNGKELMETYPTFRDSIRQLDRVLREIDGTLDWTIESAMLEPPETTRINEIKQSQTCTAALQIATVQLLESFNIKPVASCGHSSGEIAAAYVSGYISAEEALILAFIRGVFAEQGSVAGAMMAVGLGSDAVQEYLSPEANTVTVACSNSPQSVTLAGNRDDIEAILQRLKADNIFCRILNTGGNQYHSRLMKTVSHRLEELSDECLVRFPSLPECPIEKRIPWYSSVDSRLLPLDQHITPEYWRRNAESQVDFCGALTSLLQDHSVTQIIEIGPASTLFAPVRQIVDEMRLKNPPQYGSVLIRQKNGLDTLLDLAGKLFLQGFPIDLVQVNFSEGIKPEIVVDLPTYKWNHEKALPLSASMSRWSMEKHASNYGSHDLLGLKIPTSAVSAPTWRNRISLEHLPWLKDHMVGTSVVFPAMGYVSSVVEAISQIKRTDTWKDTVGFNNAAIRYTIRDLQLKVAMVILNEMEVYISFHETASEGWYEFKVTSAVDNTWQENCCGTVSVAYVKDHAEEHGILTRKTSDYDMTEPVSSSACYKAFKRTGLNYGPTFARLSKVLTNPRVTEARATVDLNPKTGVMKMESEYPVHPATLDACMHLGMVAGVRGKINELNETSLPASIEKICIWSPFKLKRCSEGIVDAKTEKTSAVESTAEFTLRAHCGGLLMQIQALKTKKSGSLGTAIDPVLEGIKRRPYHRLSWIFGGSRIACQDNVPQLDDANFIDQDSVPQHVNASFIKQLNELSLKDATNSRILLYFVYRDNPSPTLENYCKQLQGYSIRLCALKDISKIPKQDAEAEKHYISFAEFESATSLFETMTMDEWAGFQAMVSSAKTIIWVTTTASKPEHAMVSGVRRVLMSERPSLRFGILDMVDSSTVELDTIDGLEHIIWLSGKISGIILTNMGDMEFRCCDNGKLYVPRLVEYTELNGDYHQRLEDHTPQTLPYNSKAPLQIRFKDAGVLESIYWEEIHMPAALQKNEVEVRVKAAGVKVKNVYRLLGEHGTPAHSYGYVGVVTKSNVENIQPGDEVVGLEDAEYATILRVKADTCVKVQGQLNVGIPELAAAVYDVTEMLYVVDRLNACDAQNVLLELEDLFTTLISLELLKQHNINVFVVSGIAEDIALFTGQHGVPQDKIISPSQNIESVLEATGGHGFDAIVSTNTGGALEEVFELLARDGQIICLGNEDREKLETRILSNKNASVSWFNLTQAGARTKHRLLKKAVSLLETEVIRPPRVQAFHIHDAEDAFIELYEIVSFDGVAITYEQSSKNDQLLIQPLPTRRIGFKDTATYLMVGCLGGLGRRIVDFMVSRGAKSFVFLSRSAQSSPEAKSLLKDIRRIGVSAIVVKGDVSKEQDVKKAIEAAPTQIKGVVHAAMVLRDNEFEKISLKDMQDVLQPKVTGTKVLAETLALDTLDFFLATSSLSAQVGNPGQAAYDAGNAFLDCYMTHLRNRGIPAISLALGPIAGIGSMAEREDLQVALERQGLEPTNEAEFLHYFEDALVSLQLQPVKLVADEASISQADCGYLLTGMDPRKLLRLTEFGEQMMQNPRSSLIQKEVGSLRDIFASALGSSSQSNATVPLKERMEKAANTEELMTIIRDAVITEITEVLFVPAEDLETDGSLAEYGIDSLAGAELRGWLWREFSIDLSSLEMLSGDFTLAELIKRIGQKVSQEFSD